MRELVVIFAYAVFVGALNLPSFIDRCSLSDPEISKCMIRTANKLIPDMVKGLPSFGIPTLDPFFISKIDIEPTSSLKVSLSDAEIHGLRNGRFLRLWVDMKKHVGYFSYFVDKLELSASYDINGKILFLPLIGTGHGDMTIVNATFVVEIVWEIKHYEKENVNHINILSFTLKYYMDQIRTHLDNLFNGNKELGDNMNRFINENWREFFSDIEPAVGKTIAAVLKDVNNRLVSQIPAEDMFLP